ncbi:GTP cyclohydrolase I [Micromonospora echinofusca]|uniref:GTP cyclohydrolase 1 n=1 Tax=Micromonospora echinofusca TaxID=47858 RepID=A0ABS3VM93_MICEH|nr:GTP cyclohydrolase I [Micromonospora echinofusca]MBO4205586.1 GTP cyclohydrolase I FolE [Micromonospora echinofusca]
MINDPGMTVAPLDLESARDAATQFLKALGMDTDAPATVDTPARMVAAYAELLSPRPFVFTTFPNDSAYDHLVAVRAIPFHSLCEHHMLPFRGTADVAYQPTDKIVGLSKLARLVEHTAKRPQVQERLTRQIATHLTEQLAPAGVGVLVRAEHLCMTLRGAQTPGTETITTALLGTVRSEAALRNEFLHATRSGDR